MCWKFSRNRRRALWGAGMVLATLLLLATAWPANDTVAESGLAWLRRSRDVRRYVRPLTSTAVLALPPASALATDCTASRDGAGNSSSMRLLLIVTSAPAHADRRQAIRDTWGGRSEQARLLFFLGRNRHLTQELPAELVSEAQRFGDIVVEDFVDVYQNLTLKTLFMLKWALRECPSAPFILKTDDDMLINTRGLLRALPRWAPESGRNEADDDAPGGPLLLGFRYNNVRPFRDPTSKWYLPRWLFPDAVLPDFVSGTAYVMSRSALERLYATALDTPLLPLEDVFLTGVVAGERLSIPRVHSSRFGANHGIFHAPTYIDHPCLYHHMLTVHQITPLQLRRLWPALLKLQPSEDCDTMYMHIIGRLFAYGNFKVVTNDPW